MKTVLQTLSRLPAWQRERADILRRACRSLKGRIERGERIGRAARRVAARYHGRKLKTDPARTMKLRPVTLRRIFTKWEASGEHSSAFELHFKPTRSEFSSRTLIKFLDFVIKGNHSSLGAAWKAFCAGNQSLPSYYAIRWAFTAARFYEIQFKRNAVIQAGEEFQALRLKAGQYFSKNFSEYNGLFHFKPKRARI